jgi:hypothetical protein
MNQAEAAMKKLEDTGKQPVKNMNAQKRHFTVMHKPLRNCRQRWNKIGKLSLNITRKVNNSYLQ